ncbi:MAG: adenosylmethionine--8-amino-7-oxononanoate transaminase [Holosporales bacterium]|jgi:adenosylmethionine-8-amino-7-oxononanoate aminotransferase|nr:adenosylmethionine--8-amino-7-oxononanoate transaminase [Holosporales bacterium]
MKIWHPFTQEKTASLPVKIVKGKGAYLFDSNEKKYIDMVSSWWVNILGHSNKEIAEAIYKQAKTLEHVMFAGFSHEPGERLCQKLYEYLPSSLEYFFFSDDGSTAVEVALKMAYQYFKNLGKNDRNMYINLEGGYHGDTMGAMGAAGNNSKYHSIFAEFFFKTFSIDFPNSEKDEIVSLEKLKKFLKNFGENVCAIIVEPLVQGAAGMRTYRSEFLDLITKEVRKYGILVIFDEVMTGFYRTGSMFAVDKCVEKPDIICLSKGITGGFLPIALTITTEKIYESFLSNSWEKSFKHGHSYTANPIGCAAACKAIEILERRKTQQNIKEICDSHNEFLKRLSNVSNKRSLGTIVAFDVETSQIAEKIKVSMFKKGIIIRPIGASVYLIPPYCISKTDLEYVYQEMVLH